MVYHMLRIFPETKITRLLVCSVRLHRVAYLLEVRMGTNEVPTGSKNGINEVPTGSKNGTNEVPTGSKNGDK